MLVYLITVFAIITGRHSTVKHIAARTEQLILIHIHPVANGVGKGFIDPLHVLMCVIDFVHDLSSKWEKLDGLRAAAYKCMCQAVPCKQLQRSLTCTTLCFTILNASCSRRLPAHE